MVVRMYVYTFLQSPGLTSLGFRAERIKSENYKAMQTSNQAGYPIFTMLKAMVSLLFICMYVDQFM
jgi:hypothetical protein